MEGRTWKNDASWDGAAARDANGWFLRQGTGTSDGWDPRRQDRPISRFARSQTSWLVRLRRRRLRRRSRMELPIPFGSVPTNGSSLPFCQDCTWTTRWVWTELVLLLHPADMPSGGRLWSVFHLVVSRASPFSTFAFLRRVKRTCARHHVVSFLNRPPRLSPRDSFFSLFSRRNSHEAPMFLGPFLSSFAGSKPIDGFSFPFSHSIHSIDRGFHLSVHGLDLCAIMPVHTSLTLEKIPPCQLVWSLLVGPKELAHSLQR